MFSLPNYSQTHRTSARNRNHRTEYNSTQHIKTLRNEIGHILCFLRPLSRLPSSRSRCQGRGEYDRPASHRSPNCRSPSPVNRRRWWHRRYPPSSHSSSQAPRRALRVPTIQRAHYDSQSMKEMSTAGSKMSVLTTDCSPVQQSLTNSGLIPRQTFSIKKNVSHESSRPKHRAKTRSAQFSTLNTLSEILH